MKRKYLSTIISSTMVLSLLVGCGNGASNISEGTQISTTEDVTTEENSTNENTEAVDDSTFDETEGTYIHSELCVEGTSTPLLEAKVNLDLPISSLSEDGTQVTYDGVYYTILDTSSIQWLFEDEDTTQMQLSGKLYLEKLAEILYADTIDWFVEEVTDYTDDIGRTWKVYDWGDGDWEYFDPGQGNLSDAEYQDVFESSAGYYPTGSCNRYATYVTDNNVLIAVRVGSAIGPYESPEAWEAQFDYSEYLDSSVFIYRLNQ